MNDLFLDKNNIDSNNGNLNPNFGNFGNFNNPNNFDNLGIPNNNPPIQGNSIEVDANNLNPFHNSVNNTQKQQNKITIESLINYYKKNYFSIGILFLAVLIGIILSGYLSFLIADIFLVLNTFSFLGVPFLGILIWISFILILSLIIFNYLSLKKRPLLTILYFIIILLAGLSIYYLNSNMNIFFFSFIIFLIIIFDIFIADYLYNQTNNFNQIIEDIATNPNEGIKINLNVNNNDINIDEIIEKAPDLEEKEENNKLLEIYEEIKEWVESENINIGILVDVIRDKMVGVKEEYLNSIDKDLEILQEEYSTDITISMNKSKNINTQKENIIDDDIDDDIDMDIPIKKENKKEENDLENWLNSL